MDLGLRGRHREGGEEHERTEDEIAVRGGMINKGEPLHITIAEKGVLAIFLPPSDAMSTSEPAWRST